MLSQYEYDITRPDRHRRNEFNTLRFRKDSIVYDHLHAALVCFMNMISVFKFFAAFSKLEDNDYFFH